ncbi:hypothetical protein RIVM261_030490 [Rivularia sp. IAM M-261]|nr:hypothetical protein CAL7716_010110 [Calothrix sp. PCC 7716]GJD18093.1 hypothetical protein RIVM261_030490 [Rivularia sp. IAM M-261]
MTLQKVIDSVKQLSTIDKLRLIQEIIPDIERELLDKPTQRKSLWGLCAHLEQAPDSIKIDTISQDNI